MPFVLLMIGGLLLAAKLFMIEPETPVPLTLKERIYDAILAGIVRPLGLPQIAASILMLQSSRETERWGTWYFPETQNLFNIHKGRGRGEWSGTEKYVGPGDTDVRIYVDVYQSARDMARLIKDPLYARGLAALRAGDGAAYFRELEAAGFNNHNGDYNAYAGQWDSGSRV